MTTILKIGAVAACVALALTSWALLRPSRESPAQQPRATTTMKRLTPVVAAPAGAGAHAMGKVPDPARSARSSSGKKPDYREIMKHSDDYWALAHEMLARAKVGDARAMYMLYKLNDWCHRGNAYLLKGENGKPRTLEEALAVPLPWATPDLPLVYSRCHKFYSEDLSELGDPMVWLQRATDAGDPLALATTAGLRLLQEQDKAFVRAGAVPTGFANDPPIGGANANPRDLLETAIKTAGPDPDVLFEIGTLQGLLHPGESRNDSRTTSLAWKYLSCVYGADCSGLGEPVMIGCEPHDAHCVGVPSMWLQVVNNDWTPVARKAEHINAALQAQQWDQLPGLTASN